MAKSERRKLAKEEARPTRVRKLQSSASEPVKAAKKAKDAPERVTVWWPPTKEKRKTEFSGMLWPANVVREVEGGYEVRYDNGDKETVSMDNVFPLHAPVGFGEEKKPLEVGEFCEVSNDSTTDPAAWFAKVVKVTKSGYKVSYPFHDTEDENIKAKLVRRARVWDADLKKWSLLIPDQEWDDGDVVSPLELERDLESK